MNKTKKGTQACPHMHINMHVDISQPTTRRKINTITSVCSHKYRYTLVFSEASKLCNISTLSHAFEQFHRDNIQRLKVHSKTAGPIYPFRFLTKPTLWKTEM
ncbi:hypothetical protein CRENBAI_020736 [Crenichthys baileyi]|uniref:Uncharacterized protein n=1 Tax=Crenichthys baileyi TaxID=28760 RepID=A0AAV9R9F1_9TELE